MAGYGQLEGYEEAPGLPGAYRFKTRTGQWVTATGPAAEDMRKKLDEANATGPQKTAMLSMPNSAAEAVKAAAALPPAISPLTRPGPTVEAAEAAEAERRASGNIYQPTGGQPQPTEGTPPMLARPQVPGDASNLGLGLRMGEDGRIYEFRGPSAGSKGGWVERSKTIQGGHDLNPEYEAAQDKFQGQEQRAVLLGAEAAAQDATAQASYDTAMRDYMANQAVEAQKTQDEAQARFNDINAKHARLEKDYLGSKVDPSQVTSGVPGFIAVLGAAMGTFGASLSGGENFAGKILQSRIADNIAAQEKAIAIKRDGADNALKRLTEETGNLDLAKASLKSIQLGRLKAQLEVDMKDGRDTQRQANAVKMHTIVSKQYADAEEERRIRAQGVVTKQLQNAPATAGSRGGWAPVRDQLGTASALQGVRKGEMALAGAAAGPGAAKLPTSTAEKVAGLDAGMQALDRLDLAHAQMDRGGVMQERFGDSAKFAADVDALVPVVDAAKQGGAPNESTMEALRSALKSGNGAKIKAAITAERQILEDRKAALVRGASGTSQAPSSTEPQ